MEVVCRAAGRQNTKDDGGLSYGSGYNYRIVEFEARLSTCRLSGLLSDRQIPS